MNRTISFALLLGLAWSLPAIAQSDRLAGEWDLTLLLGGNPTTGRLSITDPATGLAAFVDGGPAALELDGDRIELRIDYRDGGGRRLEYQLSGRVVPDLLEGELTRSVDELQGTWRAIPATTPPRAAPSPVDLSGVWSRTSGGISKVLFDFTTAGEADFAAWDHIDDPVLRCVSPGLVRVSGWPYPMEIVQQDHRIIVLYESFHEVRRIDLDGRAYPTELPNRSMGYSLAHWDGSTLVVETEKLMASHVDLDGQPLSAEARVVERIYLEDDGQTLVSEMTIDDPVNYNRPLTKHRRWRRAADETILQYDCDPYPFFRGLELEGRLEEYWQRMRQR